MIRSSASVDMSYTIYMHICYIAATILCFVTRHATIVQIKFMLVHTRIISMLQSFVDDFNDQICYVLGMAIYETVININDRLNDAYLLLWQEKSAVTEKAEVWQQKIKTKLFIKQTKRKLLPALHRKVMSESRSISYLMYFAKIILNQIDIELIGIRIKLRQLDLYQFANEKPWIKYGLDQCKHQRDLVDQLFKKLKELNP